MSTDLLSFEHPSVLIFCLKLIEIVILWVYYTIPFGWSLFLALFGITFQLFNYFVWLRITEEGSASKMRIWSILLIKSDLKWCICLSRNLLLYLITLVLFRDPSVSPYLDLIRCPGQVCSIQWRGILTTTSVWSVVLILSDLYLCIHISRYLFFLYFSYLARVTAGESNCMRGDIYPSCTVDYS